MKYIPCVCMLGIPDEIYDGFSEHSEISFALGKAFHIPDKNMYLIEHDYKLIPTADAEKLKFNVITKEGGV